MAKDLAIILNSGSVNSAVISALAAQKYRPVFVHGEVPAAAGSRARAAYDLQVAHYKPYREHTIPTPPIEPAARKGAAADPRARDGGQRQLLELLPLLAAGARLAAHYQASALYIGLRVGLQGDELATATEYVQIWNELLQLPCGQKDLELNAPLLELEAWQVIDLGFQISAPLEKSWSCDEDGADPCWACRGCRAREAAFQQAAKADPLHGVKKV